MIGVSPDKRKSALTAEQDALIEKATKEAFERKMREAKEKAECRT
jgi:hypothetical protein